MHVDAKKNRDEEEEESSPPAPPDGGWGWMVVFGSFMIHLVNDGVTYSFGIFYDEFLDYFNEGKSKTSWILSTLVGVTLCSGPLSSSLVNKYGCRPVTIGGAIFGSICLIVSCLARNVNFLILTIGVGAGIGFGLIYLPAIVSVTTYFEKKRSLATGIAVCGSGFGTFVFAPLITYLLHEFGWRGSILIISGIVLECMIFGSLFRPLEYDEVKEVDSENNRLQLKATEGRVDIHVSDHDLRHFPKSTANGKMHRPHSVAHFSLPKTSSHRHEQNGHANNQGKFQSKSGARLAFSQPMLAANSRTSYGSQHFRKHGPLDRPDVFYQGSLLNIPSYRSKLDLKNRTGEESAFLERKSSICYKKRKYEAEEEKETTLCGIQCSAETKETMEEMLDFSLFTDVIFILFTISNFLTSIGFNIPYVFLVSRAKSVGLTAEDGSMLLSIIGIANTIGRIVLGYISDKPWVNRLYVYNWSLTICGIATMCCAFCNDFVTLAIYASVFGSTIGVYVGLTSVILVDLLGLDKLTNAFGLLLLFQGIASLVGPPLGGALYDILLSYDYAFYLSGATIALSGTMLFVIPAVQRYLANKTKKRLAVPVEI
ncbi:monocarboxylate transporter 9 [Coccinella septempunctata]|uniref:monocarboxylate transporter 9 n=1 Tax=Coccinella septempunctata TaxID=41139 RepID=UPI001D06C70B|nr:monocarboxylate transporter 9 [Coccinella septempunctata]